MNTIVSTIPPKISIIVPCYKQADELYGCLNALTNQSSSIPYEIIVVDSGNDPKVRKTASQFPRIRIITGENRLYCGTAKHKGALNAKSDFLAFTDSDCRPDPNWIQLAYSLLESGLEMTGGPILDALPWHPIAISDNVLQFSSFQPSRPEGTIKHIPGANIIITKQAYIKAGGFGLFNSGDDVTLTINYNKTHEEGIYFSPQLRVRHLGRQTLSGYLTHQQIFGIVRGEMGLFLSKKQIRLGQKTWMIPGIIIKRFLYILGQSLKYNPLQFVRNLFLSPLIFLGLAAYAAGFQQGCRLNIQSLKEYVNG